MFLNSATRNYFHQKKHLKKEITIAILLLLKTTMMLGQENKMEAGRLPGMLSIGTRNTFSLFNDDNGTGKGIGGQARLQLSNRLGSEWFFDYITSKNGSSTFRNDYHFGWSLMYYTAGGGKSESFLQPYILAGHCFDYSKVTEQADKTNNAGRWSMATQAGLGTHLNFTSRLDCSLSAQYMLHFGKDLEASTENGNVIIEKKDLTTPDGHFLVTISFNYQLLRIF